MHCRRFEDQIFSQSNIRGKAYCPALKVFRVMTGKELTLRLGLGISCGGRHDDGATGFDAA